MRDPKKKPLSYSEKRELAELWVKASAAAEKEGKKLASQWVTDMGERAALEELRREYA